MQEKEIDTTITPYYFRHTFAYTLESLDVDDRIVWRLFGKLPKDSMSYYTHRNGIKMK